MKSTTSKTNNELKSQNNEFGTLLEPSGTTLEEDRNQLNISDQNNMFQIAWSSLKTKWIWLTQDCVYYILCIYM